MSTCGPCSNDHGGFAAYDSRMSDSLKEPSARKFDIHDFDAAIRRAREQLRKAAKEREGLFLTPGVWIDYRRERLGDFEEAVASVAAALAEVSVRLRAEYSALEAEHAQQEAERLKVLEETDIPF